MTANCRRCHGFGSTLAPASRRIVNFLRLGRTAAGPWSPPMASTATFRLGPCDGDDLPALVVTAVRADSVRQLDLAALRTERARRRRELVMRAAFAPARLRVASFRQRHGGASL